MLYLQPIPVNTQVSLTARKGPFDAKLNVSTLVPQLRLMPIIEEASTNAVLK